MTANQTKCVLSAGFILIGGVIAAPFYWWSTLKTDRMSIHPIEPVSPSNPAISTIPGPTADAMPVSRASKTQDLLLAQAPTPLKRSPLNKEPVIRVTIHHSKHPTRLHASLRPYHYVFSGTVQGSPVPSTVCLLLQSDLIGERQKTVSTKADGSFVIRGGFHDHPQGHIDWHLMTLPQNGSNPVELYGRLILTDDTDVHLERDLLISPS